MLPNSKLEDVPSPDVRPSVACWQQQRYMQENKKKTKARCLGESDWDQTGPESCGLTGTIPAWAPGSYDEATEGKSVFLNVFLWKI